MPQLIRSRNRGGPLSAPFGCVQTVRTSIMFEVMSANDHRIGIKRYLDLAPSPALQAGLDAVFFDASSVKTFASDSARAQFRERWLGRYLEHDPEFAFVAVSASGDIAGYLAGALDDPARCSRFSDIAYFADFKHLTQTFPAHLHVNLAASARNRGVGSALLQHFVDDARRAGAPGVHVVTSEGARNASFYERNGFVQAGISGAAPAARVFLARSLTVSRA